MSRIERALEKAVKLREATKEGAFEDAVVPEHGVALPGAEEGRDVALDLSRVDRHLISITESNSAAAEQYRKLRARIMMATRKDFLNTIMITSSDVAEGKSITATNLAIAISNEIDHTALLVDADLRDPSIHKYLGIEPKYGLSDYLKGEVELSELLIRVNNGKLVILPGGNSSENPAELLSSDKMKRLIQELKHGHRDRYVIIDSSPVLATADSLSLGSCVDGIVFVVQADHTSERTVTQALSLMKGYNIIGVVFNNVPQYLTRRLYPYYSYRNRVKEAYLEKIGTGNGQNEASTERIEALGMQRDDAAAVDSCADSGSAGENTR